MVDAVHGCGPYLALRSYLTRHFWLPMYYTANLLLSASNPGGSVPYAGFATDAVPAPLADARAAYGRSAFDEAGRAVAQALAPGVLTGKNLEEARLIDCKVSLRQAEADRNALGMARRKLEDFLASAHDRAFAGEARGWLARVFYLQKDYVRAALIYLDETEAGDSPLKRDTLATSLRWSYSAGAALMWDRAEEFFDTPRHALFLVNVLTNQTGYYPPGAESRRLTKERGAKLIALLQEHPTLFRSGPDSEALILALMRTALYLGDPVATSKYAAAAPKTGALAQNVEFNWMASIARFAEHDFAGAEAPLLRMLNAPSASPEDRATATQALVGVYLKTQRKVEALHASFIQNSEPMQGENWQDIVSPRMQWCFY
jgi:hypothetical protein